jgi:intraflagellar transport protein 74
MNDKVGQMQGHLQSLNADIGHAEEQLSRDMHREEVALLERKLAHLQEEERELAEELSSSALNPADARAKLLAKVKSDNGHIKELDAKLRGVQAALGASKAAAAELGSDIQRRSADGSEGQKMEALFAKDQEMTQFIDSFPTAKAKEDAEQQRVQETVVALLEHISGEVGREGELPSLSETEQLKGELKDKQTELERSQATKERLRSELVTRQGELKRLDTLDGKIEIEIGSLRGNISSMRGDMGHLQDVHGLQAASDVAQERMGGLLAQYTARADSLRHVVGEVTRKEEEAKTQLEHNGTATALAAQEARMKHFEHSIFNMRQCTCPAHPALRTAHC